MKTIQLALAALSLFAMPACVANKNMSTACDKCCKDTGKVCKTCCADAGKTCGKDCCADAGKTCCKHEKKAN